MKKSLKWSLTLAAVASIGVAAAVPWSYRDSAIKAQLANQIRNTTGLELTSTEYVTIALLPLPHIKLRSVEIKDRWGTLNVNTQILKGNLRLLSLITGKLEVSTLSLFLPTIVMNLHGRPLHDRGAIARASSAAKASRQARAADATRLGTIMISGGRMLITDNNKKVKTQIGDINATLDWSRIKSPAAFSGEFIWRGEKVSLDATIANPGELLRAQTSPLRVKLGSRLLQLAAEGTMTAISGWQFHGNVEASTSAFPSLLSVTQTAWPLPSSISEVAMKGKIKARQSSLSLTNLELAVDGSKFSGALAILQRDKRPLVTATLATDNLTIDHRSANLPRLSGARGTWNKAPLPLRPLAILDMDLRLSASNARFDNFKAEDVAIVAAARNGSLELSVSSPKTYTGSLRANLKIAMGPALPALTGAINFRAIDARSFLASTAGRLRLSGRANGELQFRSAGDNFADIASLMSGSIKFRLSKGSIGGIDLGKALGLAKTQPLSIPDRIRDGSTLLEEANITAAIKDGRIFLGEANFTGGLVQSTVTGDIFLPKRQLNLAISTSLITPGKPANKPAGLSLNLEVTGPWNRPSIAPNPESLISRSRAAKPLLEPAENQPASDNKTESAPKPPTSAE